MNRGRRDLTDDTMAPSMNDAHASEEPGNSGIDDQDTSVDDRGHRENRSGVLYDSHFTIRAVVVGLAIGILLCFCNIYFGLQTGWGDGMSIPASLLGFAVFKALPGPLKTPFTPIENVLIQTVAGATGTMPLGSGFTGIMPAINFLLDESEGAPVDLSLWRLLIWSMGLNLFGVIFAVPLRREVIVREKLKFPTGTATAVMIGVLHGKTGDKQTVPQNLHVDDEVTHELLHNGERSEHSPYADEVRNADQAVVARAGGFSRESMQLLSKSFAVSGIYTFLTYLVPQVRNLPIFGTSLARDWLWTLNPSPAYIGQGIIMGPATTSSMFLGAMFGWGILSPLAKKRGWAPGAVDDWERGSRGWIAWVALVIMLTDALINLGWFMVKSILRVGPNLKYQTIRIVSTWKPSSLQGQRYAPIPSATSSARVRSSITSVSYPEDDTMDDAPSEHLVSNRSVFVLFAFSLVVCIAAMQLSFGSIIVPQLSVLAVFLGVLLSIMGVRATGETDLNPASGIGKITQVVFALFTTRDNPHRVLVNLLAGQVADAGAGQAGDMMQDLKTGHLLKASPRAQFFGALIGSIFGALISPFIYRLYTSAYDLPGTVFPIPQAYVWIFAARLVTGGGLPEMVGTLGICVCIIFTVLTLLRICLRNHKSANVRKWQTFVPGGIAFAIGMYNPPSFTLARAIGGAFSMWWIQYRKLDETTLTVLASGLVLGEGIVSIVSLMLATLGVPHL